mmetsp:Transcript_3826/g.6484  ORF Transcript_3826/g.6484 Transcript_3826/m.6484 type:complete len:259 (-) Transcript_3826:217-993(-)
MQSLLLTLLIAVICRPVDSDTDTPASISPSYWCPGQCNLKNAALCHNNYLFIIGTGRSGSTSLFKTLKLIPGIHLCGETSLIPALATLYNVVDKGGASLHQKMTLLEDQQKLFAMLHPVPSTDNPPLLLGSKEVHVPMDQLHFIRLLFPCSRFVFNYRQDLVAQSNSGFHKKENTSLFQLSSEREKMLQAHRELGDFQTFLQPLEEFDTEHLNTMVDWLGFEDCTFRKVGHYNFNGTYRKIRAWPRVRGTCTHRGLQR